MLDDDTRYFCELYVNGDAPYGGNAARCYREVFGDNGSKTKGLSYHRSRKLLEREDVQTYITELKGKEEFDKDSLKRFMTRNLMSIIEETSSDRYYGENGLPLSPAALRSVSVNATKALMDLHGVKSPNETRIDLGDGEGDGGITFNVIVPGAPPEEKEHK